MEEEWRDVVGYEGLYQVSNFGRVRSIVQNSNRRKRIMKQKELKSGYMSICLYNRAKPETLLVHRIVATAFIPNHLGFPQVNHKDEDKANNCVWNLEWCDQTYNNNYGTRIEKASEKKSKKVGMFSKDGTLIRTFSSMKIAGISMNCTPGAISNCCRGKTNTCIGYIWKIV